MANKSNINLILGADYNKSVEQLNKDITKIEKKLNKLNLKVQVQSGNLLTETNKKIAELQNRKSLKQIAIDMKLKEDKYIKQLNDLGKQLKELSAQGNINLNVNSGNASANVSNLNTQLKQTTATANTLGATLKNSLSSIGIYINDQTAWLALRQMISDINETIREYDKYVTELSLITNRSRNEVTGMLGGISETALNLKVDVSDVEKAETTILRAGKSIADTQILVEDAVKLSAEGFIGADEAAEHLITIANAYHLEADEMERVTDKFVKLDSAANVTARKLASAIATTASTAQLAGINIDTLAGYIAALKDTTGKTEQSISTSINIGHLRLDKITSRDVQRFVNDLLTNAKNTQTGKPLARKTVLLHLSFISNTFRYAIKMGMLSDNPCSRVTVAKQEKKEKQIYTIDEMKQLFRCLENAPIKYRAFVTLAVYSGYRRGEMLGLEWKDIDWENNVVSVRRTSNYTKLHGMFTDTTKTRKSQRSTKFPTVVMNVLRELKAEQDEQRAILGDKWVESDRLFVTDDGTPLFVNNPYKWLQKFCKDNNLRFCDVHSYRHFHASALIFAGVDPVTVSADLGHSAVSTTTSVYCHLFQEAQARTSSVISQVLDFDDDKKNTMKPSA